MFYLTDQAMVMAVLLNLKGENMYGQIAVIHMKKVKSTMNIIQQSNREI